MTWDRGTEVRRYDNPGKTGTTTGQARQRSSGLYVQVRWHQDGSTDYVAEDQIEQRDSGSLNDPYAVIEMDGSAAQPTCVATSPRFTCPADLRTCLLDGITNTDFYAHQYRPLLTLLESPADGLLIADEVGLGKTIEAGIIWTELRAREDMRRLRGLSGHADRQVAGRVAKPLWHRSHGGQRQVIDRRVAPVIGLWEVLN